MLSVKFTWLEAAAAAALVLAVAAVAALARRRSDSPRRAATALLAREAGLLLGLFALWTYAGSKSEVSLIEAVRRAAWIWHAERAAGLPSEWALQRAFLPHPLLVEALNWYYAVLHFPALIGCLVWLFAWHRGEYWRVRTLVVLFTAFSLLVQFIPVAPPRLLPLDRMTDTGLAYGQSVYGTHAGLDADQLSAMPSIHVGWALLVAIVVVTTARSRWRWLALAYPALTTLAVVVTANHFWLDGIAAAALLAASIGIQRGAGPAWRALAGRAAAAPRPDPAPGAVGLVAAMAAVASVGGVWAGRVPASEMPADEADAGADRTGGAVRAPGHAGAPVTGAPARSAGAHSRAARQDGRPGGGCGGRAAVSVSPAARNHQARRRAAGRGGHAGQSREQDGRLSARPGPGWPAIPPAPCRRSPSTPPS
jgi:hypothetical protein